MHTPQQHPGSLPSPRHVNTSVCPHAGDHEGAGKENAASAGQEDEWTDIQLQPSGDLSKTLEQQPLPAKKLALRKKLGGKSRRKGLSGGAYFHLRTIFCQHAWFEQSAGALRRLIRYSRSPWFSTSPLQTADWCLLGSAYTCPLASQL